MSGRVVEPLGQGRGQVEGHARWRVEAAAAIDEKHRQVGAAPGARVGELQHVGGAGFMQVFQRGRVYWHVETGAHWVLGAILEHYANLGGPDSWAGYPLSDETPATDGVGRLSTFQHAVICWHPASGAFEVHGDISAAWGRLGGTTWGYPICDERPTSDGVGRFNHFRVGGSGAERSIHWHPDTGAHGTVGAARDRWISLGWEAGYLGYPTDDGFPLTGGLDGGVQHFQRGRIEAVEVPGLGVGAARDVPTVVEKFMELSTGGVRAVVRLAISSNGMYAYSGSFENDAVISLTAVAASALNFKTSTGHVIVVSEEADLAGELTPGSESHTWNKGGHEPLIQSHWDQLKDAGLTTRLDTDIGVGDVINLVLAGLPVALGVGIAVLLAGGSHKACPPTVGPEYHDSQGNPHRDVEMEIKPKDEPCG